MKVDSVESTPNPSAFLLRLDGPLEGVAKTGLRGVTYRPRDAASCPASLTAVVAVEGVDSVFVVQEVVTISKLPSAKWTRVLPPVIGALGGGSEALSMTELAELLSLGDGAAGGVANGAADARAPAVGGVRIRLQVSQKLPIQVEAAGWSGLVPPMRAKLSARFGSAMGLLIGQSGDAFFAGRAWLDRGLRYPDSHDDGAEAHADGGDAASGAACSGRAPGAGGAGGADGAGGAGGADVDVAGDALAAERRAVAAALAAELAEIETAWSDDRLATAVYGGQARARAARATEGGARALTLREVEELCDEDAACAAAGEAGLSEAVRALCALVANGEGAAAARRTAIAYLGSTAGRGGDVVFEALVGAFKREAGAGLRRTAGDALSDLGDTRAAPAAAAALTDRSPLVRWRAARLAGELGADLAVGAALRQAALEEGAFEVAFELKDARRRVERRCATRTDGADGGGPGASGPMWKQIQDRPQ